MKHKQSYIKAFPVLLILSVFGIGFILSPLIHADQFDQQIQTLQQQNGQSQAAVNQLQSQASSYADAVAKLQSQIASVQADIVANQQKSVDLQNQITTAQAELDKERQVLGEDIKAMYLEGQISTLEMLASSKNLSDFLDKQEYRSSVQNKLKATLDKVTALKSQLNAQQASLQDLIKAQQSQQQQLAADETQQNQLLAYTNDQKNQYTQQITANNAKIVALRQEQIAANLANSYNISYGGCGFYPDSWCNAPQDSIIDTWGMFNRECVSYTAFRVHAAYLAGQSHIDMPNWGGIGDAYQWIQNARNAGIPVDFSPVAGDIAIRDRDPQRGYWIDGQWEGDVGHAMYVESVYTGPDGQPWIHISQYNADLTGRYSTADRPAAGLYFIHFQRAG